MLAIPRAIPVRARSLALGLPLLLTALLTLDAAPAQAAPAASAAAAVDPGDRASVAAAYRDVYLPAVAVRAPEPAAGTTTGCDAGSTPAVLQNATRDLVNYFRAMSGVGPVTFDARFSAKAQKAALIGYANGTLSHAPAPRSTCWSSDGAEAAASSNLALGYGGADVVRGYMDDAGEGNLAAGHRWWLQRPRTLTMGNGTVGGSNALWVAGESGFTTGPRYTSWPSAGYVPGPLEPRGRWSFTTWDPDYDLSRATVAVRGPGGALAVRQAPVDAAFGSLVFDVGTLAPPVGPAADAYAVTVTGILKRGEPITPYRYTVTLFDPTADVPLEATGPVTVEGSPLAGQTLRASGPTWSLPGTTAGYQWYRGSGPLPGATGPTLLLAPGDVGERVSVAVTGTAPGRDPLTVSSAPTAVVRAPAAVTVTATSPDQRQVALDVTVTAGAEPAPGGTVDVLEDGTEVARGVTLTAGRATAALADVTPGTHRYTVRFAGSPRVAPATATAAPVTVGGPVAAELDVEPRSTAPGRLALDVVVSAAGEPAPDGRLEVRDGSRLVGTTTSVTDGRATWSVADLAPGDHTLTVRWLGSSRVAPAAVTTVATVQDRATAAVAVTPTSSSVGALALAVAVEAAGGPVAGGTVTVTEGSRTVASGLPVVAGRATWTATGLASGAHTYVVSFSGTAAVKPARSTVAATVRAKVRPTLTLTGSSPSSRKAAVAVTVRASGQTGLGGTVTVKEGSTTLRRGLAVTKGRATWTATGRTPGRHTYTVVYSGTSQVTGRSATVAVTVKK